MKVKNTNKKISKDDILTIYREGISSSIEFASGINKKITALSETIRDLQDQLFAARWYFETDRPDLVDIRHADAKDLKYKFDKQFDELSEIFNFIETTHS